jgi:hypothetical protein
MAVPMWNKQLLRNALLALALGSVAYLAAQELAARRAPQAPNTAPVGAETKLVVYYFSTGKECTTCEQIPAYAKEAVEAHFAADLASGGIAWRAVDVDDPVNEHFIADFQIYTKSIVLVAMNNGKQGRWKNLEKVWDLVYDKAAFMEYIRAETRAFMDAPA